MSKPFTPPEVSADALMGEVVDDFLERLGRGEEPDVEGYARRYPDLATVLRQMLPALHALHSSGAGGARSGGGPGPDLEPEAPLGDFRVVREVGRGGMGVVYEAVQLSLGRRVALKVLPFAAALDAKQLARFRNEAQAAAHLHHQHIVPVYFVGVERGVHFYAMQFIDGMTLADLVQEMRRGAGPGPEGRSDRGTVSQAAGHLVSDGGAPTPAVRPGPAAETAGPSATFPTECSTRTPAFIRTVANLAVQAAEALEHAHRRGVVHRDVKPGNLLVDGEGTLWVTDFGLAQVRSDTRLTRTGDLVGTLRYMSPEQALALPSGVDHRTDVYSLGATLYELLTLEPPFPGRDGPTLLRQIASEEPKPPRRLNRAVPAELETIVLKALAKDPAERYATAQEMADDLGRFLRDEPIRARKPSLAQRARKWARRHRPAVWSAALASLVTLAAVAGALGWVLRDRAARRAWTASEVRAAVEEGERFRDEGKWPQARAAALRAEALLAGGGGDELRQGVGELLADLDMVARLEEVRLLGSGSRQGYFDSWEVDRGYANAFRDYGIDVDSLDTRVAGERIGARAIRVELAAALDGWAQKRRWIPRAGRKGWRDLLGVARAADPDPRRTALRDAVLRGDRRALVKWAATEPARALPPTTLVLLAEHLGAMGGDRQAIALLRRAQEQYPGDFWINHTLAFSLAQLDPPRCHQAIPFYTAAVALRPESAGVRLNFGNALAAAGRLDSALAAFHRAIELQSDFAEAHCNLGKLLWQLRRPDESVEALQQAIKLKPHLAEAHGNLGVALFARGRHQEAVTAFRKAIKYFALRKGIEWTPDWFVAHNNLGRALWKAGRLDDAIEVFGKASRMSGPPADRAAAHTNLGHALVAAGRPREALTALRDALKLKPDYAEAHDGMGKALCQLGRLDESVAAYTRAIELKPDLAEAHCNLGVALARQGRLDEAIAADRKAIELKPDLVRAHFNLGIGLTKKGRLDEAMAAYRRAIALKPDYAEAHYDLGNALGNQGKLDEAVASYRKAIALKPDYAEAHCNLAYCLRRQGEFARALVAYRRGHELGSKRMDWTYPSGRWVSQCRRLVELDGREEAFLRGEVPPAGAAEENDYAQLCYCKKRYAAAARLWADAFAADPKLAGDLEDGPRYDAACAAALAGCGRGVDAGTLGDRERARWRGQALAWLRADLTANAKLLEGGKPQDRERARERLRSWRSDSNLAGLRDPAALAGLPAGERNAYERLWAEVRALLSKADPPG